MFNFKLHADEYKVWFRHASVDPEASQDQNIPWKGWTKVSIQNLTTKEIFSITTYCSKMDNYSRYEGRVHALSKLIHTLFPMKVDGVFSAENFLARQAIVEEYTQKSVLTPEDRESLLYVKPLVR